MAKPQQKRPVHPKTWNAAMKAAAPNAYPKQRSYVKKAKPNATAMFSKFVKIISISHRTAAAPQNAMPRPNHAIPMNVRGLAIFATEKY